MADPYAGWSLSDRLEMLAFEAEHAQMPRELRDRAPTQDPVAKVNFGAITGAAGPLFIRPSWLR